MTVASAALFAAMLIAVLPISPPGPYGPTPTPRQIKWHLPFRQLHTRSPATKIVKDFQIEHPFRDDERLEVGQFECRS